MSRFKPYPQPKSHEWVNPVLKDYKMACCDCGLVHSIDFGLFQDLGDKVKRAKIPKKHLIAFRVRRDSEETRKMRKYYKIRLRTVDV